MIEFDDIEDFQRNREIEAEGTIIGFSGGRWIKVAAASDANPKWRARGEKILAEMNRLRNAKASPERIRAFLAKHYAECLGRDWGGWKSKGVEIPYSDEAFTALMIKGDDVYATIDQIVFETKNFRGQRIEAIVDEGKGESSGT